jgi:hypothetical protein
MLTKLGKKMHVNLHILLSSFKVSWKTNIFCGLWEKKQKNASQKAYFSTPSNCYYFSQHKYIWLQKKYLVARNYLDTSMLVINNSGQRVLIFFIFTQTK